MKSLLLLRNIEIENANAITGLTYGFPGIANFLGFTHALSRKLERTHGLRLGGCAVIVHDHDVHAYQPGGWGDWVFALTRNPLTKEGNTAPFNEEGRMHLTVSLLIECEFNSDDLPFGAGQSEKNIAVLTEWLCEQAYCLRLAGGTIASIRQVSWFEIKQELDDRNKQFRRVIMRLLPGFVLVGRHDLLQSHHQKRVAESTEAELLDSLLEFVALQYQCEILEQGASQWVMNPKPAAGYLVPLAVGYQAISPLYDAGVVSGSRDPETPFCFVESAYSLGQWLSPHRVQSLEKIIWRYRYDDGLYLCQNGYSSVVTEELINSEDLY